MAGSKEILSKRHQIQNEKNIDCVLGWLYLVYNRTFDSDLGIGVFDCTVQVFSMIHE